VKGEQKLLAVREDQMSSEGAPMETGAPPVSQPVSSEPAGETYSAAYVNDLKAQLQRQTEQNATMKARQEAEDSRKREYLTTMQPIVTEWVKEAVEDETMAPFRHEFGPLTAFGEGLSQATSIDTALPFARAISCHSAKFKRKVEEFSQTKDASDRLAAANKELDEVKADRDTKASRIAELENLCDERLKAAEAMQEKLAKYGGITEKYDFSKLGSRETAPPEGSQSSSGTPKGGAPSRSAPPAQNVDPLFAFVGKSGGGGLRIGQSGTAHHFLGNVSGQSSEADISAAIRAGGI